MNNKEIFEKINSIIIPSENYLVFQVETSNCFFGKDSDGNVVFMMNSLSPKIPSIQQETKSLKFIFNKKCILQFGGSKKTEVMHVLTCKDKETEKIRAFIRLTKSFSFSDTGPDQYYLAKLFSSISALFDKQRQVSEIEMQSLFAELYTILHLRSAGCDIAKYWQSRNKMKFDFSIDAKRRIEIKSTLKSERIHHFRHDQLLSELYDIKVVSILLRKNDCGVSLGDVVEQMREIFANDFALMLHIENTISQIDDDYLYGVKYDELYLKNNIRFFDAKDIPHFNEKSPDGVFNAEYDCNLEMARQISMDEMKVWIV